MNAIEVSAKRSKNTVAVQKHKWIAAVRKLDLTVQVLRQQHDRGSLTVPLVDYKRCARRICTLGDRGEALLDRSVENAVGRRAIADIRDILNVLDLWSDAILKIVTHKWLGEEPGDWPIYRCDVAPTSELVSQSQSIKALNEMVDEMVEE